MQLDTIYKVNPNIGFIYLIYIVICKTLYPQPYKYTYTYMMELEEAIQEKEGGKSESEIDQKRLMAIHMVKVHGVLK